jgi:hypothetical protein
MEKLYSRVFCISERMFMAESITIAKNQELNVSENEKKERIRARSRKFMIKKIDGLQYLYTKDAKTVVTEENKKNE